MERAALALRTEHGGESRGVLLSEQEADLSLLDAVALGLRNNRSIQSSYLRRIAQKFDLRVAEDAFSPKLYINGTYRANRNHQDRYRDGRIGPTAVVLGEYGTQVALSWSHGYNEADVAGRRRNDGVDLTLIQPLLRNAGREVNRAPVRIAQLAEQANRLALKSSVSQTITAIISAYRNLLRAQEQLRIARAALERTRELVKVNRSMIEAGRMAEFEIVQTEADLATQELGVEEAANQVDTSRLELLRLLALDLSSRVRASDELGAEPMEVNREQALHLAEQQQPDYLRQLIAREQADLNLVIAENQRLWDVSLEVGAASARIATATPPPAAPTAPGTATPASVWTSPSATCRGARRRCRRGSTSRTRPCRWPMRGNCWSATSPTWCATWAPAGASWRSPTAPWPCPSASWRSSGRSWRPGDPATSRCSVSRTTCAMRKTLASARCWPTWRRRHAWT